MNPKRDHVVYQLVIVALCKEEIQRLECYLSLLLSL